MRYTDPTGLGAENEVGDGRIYDDTTGKYYNSDGTLCSNQSDTAMGDDEGTNSVEDGGGSGGGGGSGEGGSGGAGVGEKVRAAGAALLTGTLAEDVFTGGAGVFDDLITVPAAIAAIAVGTILMATADDADMPQAPEPSSAGNMQKQVERGHAPPTVDRVEGAGNQGEQPHVHFKDQRPTVNQDGTWGHGGPGRPLTGREMKWLLENGWRLPE